jgi:hypothetical protein
MEIYRFYRHQGPSIIHQNLCLSSLGICGGQPSVEIAAAAKQSSAPLVNYQGAHSLTLYTWSSKFRTFMIIKPKMQKIGRHHSKS